MRPSTTSLHTYSYHGHHCRPKGWRHHGTDTESEHAGFQKTLAKVGDCKPHKKGHTPGTIWAGARSGGRKPDQYAQPRGLTTECAQPECAFPSSSARRMRFFVRVCSQNAPFRRMRLFLPGQTWRRLTEKHILYSSSHGKAHSSPGGVTKTAFWASCARSMTCICACTTTPISKSPRTTRASSADRVGWGSRQATRTVRCRSLRRRPHFLSSLILST